MGQSCCKKIPDLEIEVKNNNICQDIRCHSKCLSTCCISQAQKQHHKHHHHKHHTHEIQKQPETQPPQIFE
jgi:hypothetical protein